MSYLIVGGNGFIGSYFVDEFVERNIKVRVFDREYERYRPPLNAVDYRISKTSNLSEFQEALIGVETVIYLASNSVPSTSNLDINQDVKSNLLPFLNCMNLMIKVGVKKIVYFSSGGAIYGIPRKNLIDENHPLDPISSYGIMKLTIEKYIHLYHRLYGIDSLIIRPSNPYGPRQGHLNAQGVISTFLNRIKMNAPITIYGNGNSFKDYIFITDLVRASMKLIMNKERGIYNIGSGKGESLNSIIEVIENVTGIKTKVVYDQERIYDVSKFVLDNSKCISAIGEFVNYSLDDGIKETWVSINKNK